MGRRRDLTRVSFLGVISWVLVRSQDHTIMVTVYSLSVFITPKQTPFPMVATALSPPPGSRPWCPLIYFVSAWICLLETFHVTGSIPPGPLCAWLLSLRAVGQVPCVVAAVLASSFV